MKWLATYKKEIGRDQVLRELRSLPCEIIASEQPVPLGTDEEVLSVEGPDDLALLAKPFHAIVKIYPNSKMSAFGSQRKNSRT